MTAKTQLKTTFTVQYVNKEIYTGGPLAFDEEFFCLFCPAGSLINVLDLQSGRVIQTLSQERGDSMSVTAVACCTQQHTVAASYTSGQLAIWTLTSEMEHEQEQEVGNEERGSNTTSAFTASQLRHCRWVQQALFRVGMSAAASVHAVPTVHWLEWNREGTLIACATHREVLVYDARGKWLTHWLRLSAKLLPSSLSNGTSSVPTPQGPVQICRFHPSRPLLYAADQLGAVWVWDLTTRFKDTKMRPLTVLHHHLSVVTDIAFLSNDPTTATTTASSSSSSSSSPYDVVLASRDKTVSVWSSDTHSLKTTLTTFESLEAVVVVAAITAGEEAALSSFPQRRLLITAGERGVLRCWDLSQAERQPVTPLLYEQPPLPSLTFSLDYLFFAPRQNKVLSVTSDQNIQIHDVRSLRVERTIVGFNDEIIDMALLDADRKLVVATNSEQVRLYTLKDMSCTLLTGHRDLVLCVDVTRDGAYIATGSKDAEIRVWCSVPNNDNAWCCVAVCSGHTDAVTSLAFAHRSPKEVPLLVSASRDRTIKGWDLSALSLISATSHSSPVSLPALFTYKAHDQEINSIAIAPTDTLLATGSQDKTIKLWRLAQDVNYSMPSSSSSSPPSPLAPLTTTMLREWRECATLTGHRRGVWCVAFSPTDQLLASASGDHLIKIWAFNLNTHTYRCVKTLEGHTSTVLKVVWTRDGLQCVSAGADGVVILWNVFTEEAINRFDAHTDKVWSMVLTQAEDQLITGGADSRLIFWRNVTDEEREAQRQAAERRTLAEQQLHNSIVARDWSRALKLALNLKYSHQLYTVLDTLLMVEPHTALLTLTSLVASLASSQLLQLLTWTRDWNTNTKLSLVAQHVLYAIFRTYHPTTLISLPQFKEILQALLPYTERHYQRMDRLLQQSFIIDYTLTQLQLTADGVSSASTSDSRSENTTTSSSLNKLTCELNKLALSSHEQHPQSRSRLFESTSNHNTKQKKRQRENITSTNLECEVVVEENEKKMKPSSPSSSSSFLLSVGDLIRKRAKLCGSLSSSSLIRDQKDASNPSTSQPQPQSQSHNEEDNIYPPSSFLSNAANDLPHHLSSLNNNNNNNNNNNPSLNHNNTNDFSIQKHVTANTTQDSKTAGNFSHFILKKRKLLVKSKLKKRK